MRELVSGRDFQLRYALHRLMRLALGADPLHERIAQLRLEWPVAVDGGEIWVDALLEDEAGRIVEIIECKEHKSHIAPKSVRTFLGDVARLAAVAPDAKFRFVTSARHLPDGSAPSPGKKPPVAADRIVWELDTPDKESLAAECIAYFARNSRDPFSLYGQLYARLAAQMAARLQRDGKVFIAAIRDIHAWLYPETDAARLSADLSLGGEAGFPVADLRGALQRDRLPRQRARDASRINVATSVVSGLLSDSSVTLEQIFIEPLATAVVHGVVYDVDTDRSFTAPALSLLFQWLAASRSKAEGRLTGSAGSDVPLLVLGEFGFGKTSLLAIFAERMLNSDPSITPIFVRLRKLKAAGTTIPLISVLRQHVRDTHGIDIDECTDEICLLCDGFDELNLFYTRSDQHEWVEEGYRQLSFLAQRPNITVVLSSRPILFMASAAALRDGATRLHLQNFDDDRIRRWCERYRDSAGLGSELSLEFLAERDLVEVARTPLVLYMIARIFETQREMLEPKRYTRSEVYRLFITWTERGRYRTDEEKHALPENYREILQEIAWLFFQSGKGALGEDELLAQLRATFGRTVDSIPIDRNILVAHMLRPGSDESGTGGLIEFTHQSFREYLVAERIWRLLAPARAGEALAPETWMSLTGRVLTEAKIDLLGEMVATLPEGEAAALYHALDGADNVHSYWTVWSRPAWEGKAPYGQRTWFDTLPTRAAGMAVLAFILRVAAYRRCADLRGSEPDFDPPRTDTLQRMLSFLQTFPDAGVGKDAESLLLQNLRGLRLSEVSSLDGIDWAGVDLTGCRLTGINFEGSTFGGLVAPFARFTRCNFSRTIFQLTAVDTTFEECDFSAAQLLLEESTEPSGLRFVDCHFDGATFESLELRGATFHGCNFARSAVLRDLGREAFLIDCDLDASARIFFDEMLVRVSFPERDAGGERRPAPAARRPRPSRRRLR
ncbi:MAG TPA: pentapeptide repeat-containing protein [Thermoanaerobaculia bacterium]|nr:pentapeptide repeat-containing protein [Thermoanaerobaculia bacterium]